MLVKKNKNKMLVTVFFGYLKLTFEMTWLNIRSAMEYRISFLVQVFGMIINDTAFVAIWYLYFKTFPKVNGWGFEEMILFMAVGMANFGLVLVFFRGLTDLAKTIAAGGLDYFLGLPKNVLWHAAVSKTEISAIGDFFMGLILFFLSGNFGWEKILLYIFLVIITSTIFASFLSIVNTLGFYSGDFGEGAEQIFSILVGFSLYPAAVFHGALKIIIMTVIQAFFIYVLPVELLKRFDWLWMCGMIIFAIAIYTFSVWFFKKGMKRYESGNLINMKM